MAVERDTAQFLSALSNPEKAQEELLFSRILRPNQGSEYGRQYGFSKLVSVRDYQSAVPVVDYAALKSSVDRAAAGEANILTAEPVRRFFATSGSSSAAKLVPVTSTLIGDKARAFGIYWGWLYADHPKAELGRVVGNFSDSGGVTKLPSGIPVSSEGAYWSMVSAATQKRGRSPLPKSIAAIADAEERYRAIADILIKEDVSLLMALNPSTLLVLMRTVNAPAKQLWPSLELLVSWRSPMQATYLRMLAPWVENIAQRDYLLMASEGLLAIPDRDEKSGGVLATIFTFFEFIAEENAESSNPEILLSHQLEKGRTYVVLLSTTGGLYRYNIGDVVRVTDFREQTPVIEFLYRAGSTCSLTGEKLTEEQVVRAVDALDLSLEGYLLVPAKDGFPRYILLAESSTLDHHASSALDAALKKQNIEYAAKRDSLRLEAPEVWWVRAGSFAKRRAARIAAGANDAQIKPQILSRKAELLDDFEVFARTGAH